MRKSRVIEELIREIEVAEAHSHYDRVDDEMLDDFRPDGWPTQERAPPRRIGDGDGQAND